MKRHLLILALLVPATAGAQHRRHRRHRHHRDEQAAPAPAPVPTPAPSEEAPAAQPPASTTAPAALASSPAALPPLPPPSWARPPRRVAVELGPVLGMGISTSGLGVGPDLGLEVGARVSLGSGVFAFALRGAWSVYAKEGSGATPCAPMGSGGSNANPAPSSPCVSDPAQGTYGWSLTEMLVRIALPLSYRFLPASNAFNAYVGVAPTLTLQRAETTAFSQITTETAMRFGVHGLLGAQYRLGPGAAFFEAGYAWSTVSHRATGDVSLGAVQLALGYRVSIPSD